MSNDDYAYGDYAYDQTPLVFDTSGQQPELDPYFAQMIAQMFQYPTNSRGVPNPPNLQTQNLFQNAYQDRLQTLFDPANSLLTGGLSPGAFAPEVTEKQLDFPKTGSLQVQAQMGGYQGQLAKLILRGMSPAQAAATIRDSVENQPDNVSDDERNELMMGLPTLPPEMPGGERTIDWDAVAKEAAGLATPYYEEQGIRERAGMPDSGVIFRNGKFFETTETPSPMTQMLQKQGLDNPYTQYDEDYLRRTSDFGDVESALQQNFAGLLGARNRYAGNEAQRKRAVDLERQFTGQDRAAMDRFSRNVQNAMGDYGRLINRDMTVTPQWGGGQFVGDPAATPQLGQRTGGQAARDARLREAMVPFRSFGAEGRIGATPESIKQALADYMSSTSAAGLTDVAGHPGRTMVGGAGREGQRIGRDTIRVKDPNGDWMAIPNPARAATAIDPNLPPLPSLSAYSDQPGLGAQRASMASQLLGQLPWLQNASQGLMRNAETRGKLRAQGPKTTKQQDANLRSAAYTRTHAAQLAYAQRLLAADMARRAGRTPFQDQIAARAQSMYGLGSMG